MAISLVDTAVPMNDTGYPVARAKHIWFDDNVSLQDKLDNKELSGGDNSVTLTQEEFELLSDEEKLNGLYYTYDTKRIYKNGIQYGVNEPLELTMAEFKALKEAGALDEQQEYIITTDENGVLLEASDIGYSNVVSNLNATTVQGAIDKVNDKVNNLIDDEVSDSTVWSSKKTSSELSKKSNTINISMVGLGFTKGAEVPLEDFMTAISKKMSNNYSTIYKVNWTDENSAYVVFGNKKVNINGGVLYCSQSNTITNTWNDLTILYTPNVSSPNLYKFTARKDGSTLSVYMFEYPYMADTTSSTTSTYSSAKIDEKYGSLTLASEGSTQWLKLKLGTSSKFQSIVVSDQYGGKVEILGMANDSTYKPVKLVRHSYGDWTTHSATDYTTTADGDANYKIRRFFYYPTNGYYYLEIRQWAIIKVEGNSTAEMVASLPAETSEMTLIPESQFASKSNIDGATIKTTSTTGSEYYAITFKDKQFERGNNQGILIQHNRLNFEPVTFIFSASSYSAATYERDNYDVTKINGAFYNPNSPYMMQFYMDKTNNTLYSSVPSYSGVTLMDLQFKSDVIAYTKVDAIPDTATKITVTEYATKEDLKTSSNTDLTTITFDETYATASSGGHGCTYVIKNGICYVNMDMRMVANGQICTLPKPLMSVINIPMTVFMHNVTGEVEAINNGVLMVNSDGSTKTLGALTNESRYMLNFSYPIA